MSSLDKIRGTILSKSSPKIDKPRESFGRILFKQRVRLKIKINKRVELIERIKVI